MTALTLEKALEIIQGALSKSKSQGYKPMAIAVLDAAGNLKAFASEDGASMFRFDIARAKAWASVGMGLSSRKLAERAMENPNFFVSLASVGAGRFVPQTGAVLVKNAQGEILGAVGASGGTGDEDELICIAGVELAGWVAG
ncbi:MULTISPECIES: heme-binding protein [Ramlibacter]|uniref:Heme-binding protein n=1 Tax=Ramlibacter aquaticus TaxID=2780094 RepID=A0ABR9SHR5_9BURK|nr:MULTISPECIES: heme-binding protein [Ramlibacter]MBE7941825.1 heme-binding protein [Ramlibacter aquaticus]